MKRKLQGISTLGVVLVLLASCPLAGQTFGMPFVNDLFVDLGAFGAPGGPPGGAPCPAPPVVVPPGTFFSLNVTTMLPGLVVIPVINVGIPCGPASAPPFCLPPVTGPYGMLPPVAGPCGPMTNQTVDLLPLPPTGPIAAFVGVAFGVPGAPGGLYMSPAFFNPGLGGIPISVQAMIFDPAGAGAFGMVVTNAIDLIL